MFELTKQQIASLDIHKGDITHNKSQAEKVVKRIFEDLKKNPIKKEDAKELGGYTDFRSLSVIDTKGEISLKRAMVLAQIARYNPYYVVGMKDYDENCNHYTEENVRLFLREFNMDSVLDKVPAQKSDRAPMRVSIITSNDSLKKIAADAIDSVERGEGFLNADETTFQHLLTALQYKVNTNPTAETTDVLLLIKILLTFWMK
ncbi:MAG: hypothetical protein FWE20_04035 [Defluviitaleaceae bacterium]|nr:hypothetical protein [Defluviitaleaceae bacterium]